MNPEILDLTGIYIVYPTSPALKSINRAEQYGTQVNDRHTKIGEAHLSFQSRRGGYLINFDQEVEFLPVAAIEPECLDHAGQLILQAVRIHYATVGHSPQWFQTAHRERIIGIIADTLAGSGIQFRLLAADLQGAAI